MNQTTISLPATVIARLAVAVAALPGSRFVGVTYRAKSTGELARHTLIIGADYAKQVQASRDLLAMRPTCEGDAARLTAFDILIGSDTALVAAFKELAKVNPNMDKDELTLAVNRLADVKAQRVAFMETLSPERQAAAELLNSYDKTLTALANGEENEDYTKAGLYETIAPGLAVSRADGSFELRGLSVAKVVLEYGTYKKVNSSAKTLAKQEITKTLPVGRYRSLSLDVGALESVRIGGNEIDVA